MPKDKTETHERIIPAAMKIFLEKGFEKATMREIAEEAGITAAGLYRHFVDKEAMFAALVEPVLSELQKWCERTRQVDYDFLEQGDLDAMWDSGNDLGLVVEQILSLIHISPPRRGLCRFSPSTAWWWSCWPITRLRRRQTKGKFLPSVPLPSARRWSMASALTLPQQFPIRRPMRSFMNCASS